MAEKESSKGKFTDELADTICQGVIAGKTIREICSEISINPQTLYRWLAKHDDFRRLYSASREIRTDLDIEELIDTVKTCKPEIAEVNKARLVVDTMKWIASKRVPARYGDNPMPFESRERPGITVRKDYS